MTRTILLLLCATMAFAQNCGFGLQDVGSLDDGQLRLGYGTGASNVTFTLNNGFLTSSLNFICYISYQTQLQCNTPSQTTFDSSFSISMGQLAYNGSTSWWSCNAGTGGSNLYTTQYYPQCVPATLTIVDETSACMPTTSAPAQITPTTPNNPDSSSSCLGLNNVGSLCDGQLRLSFGTGAVPISFSLSNGYLVSSLGFMCYISAQTQLQCNTPPQTLADSSFSEMNGQLAYNGSTNWWSCDAGTGGSNLYNTKYYPQCVPATLTINSQCVSTSTQDCLPNNPNSVPSSCVAVNDVGTLSDGQLRLGFGIGAVNVTFTLAGGYLTSSLGFLCYISSQTQLQCNTPPQTNADSSFSIMNGQLSYAGSTSWWSCDAGTGGSNLYTTKYYSQCVPAVLDIYYTTQCASSSNTNTAAGSAPTTGNSNNGSSGNSGNASNGNSGSNGNNGATASNGNNSNPTTPAATGDNNNDDASAQVTKENAQNGAASLACGALLVAFAVLLA